MRNKILIAFFALVCLVDGILAAEIFSKLYTF